jgi:DNA polymerase I
MPSPPVEQIEINDALKEIGVTEFYKLGTVLTIKAHDDKLLQFDIDKCKVQKTKENLEDAAYEIDFDKGILSKLKYILASDYVQHLKLPEPSDEEDKDSGVRKYHVFKYSTGIPLAEQIKLGEDYVFLQIINGKPVINHIIDLSQTQNIILYPRGNTPIIDFQYEREDEINRIIEVAKTKSIDELYFWSKSVWEKFVIATAEQITLLAADSIFTFFQDSFVTTHYTMLVARVGSGKGAILITFSYLGYRVILGGNMSGASILDLLGSLEACQVVIAEDELNNLRSDAEKWRLYTIGYDAFGLTTKTLDGSTSKRAISYYPAFSYKIFGAEISLDTSGLEGLIDRTFQTTLLKGKPKFYIKKLRKPNLSPKYKGLLSEIIYFRKVMLIYRLLHANDLFEEVETNIDGRALELTGPIIDLFHALSRDKTLLKKEILPVLSSFLRQKGEISKNSLDNIIFNVVKELSNDGTDEANFIVSHQELYNTVRVACDGDDIEPGRKFHSPILGNITKRQISGHCRDKLHAKDDSIGTGDEKKKGLSFNKQTINVLTASYDYVTKIKLLDDDDADDNHDDVGTVGPMGPSTGGKEGDLVKNEQANDAAILDKLQKADSVKRDDNNFFQNTSLSPLETVPTVPWSQNAKLNISQTLGLYVAFDLEWDESKDNTIEAVSFVYSSGNSEVKFRERDFDGSEITLLNYIMAKLLNYQWSIGWNTQGNPNNAGGTKVFDLYILHERCKANGINSIVKLGNKGLPYLIGDELKHIDLLNVYSKLMVKDGMYHSVYRTNKLDDVSKALLGYGKYKDYSGEFKALSPEEQVQYSLRDSQLVMELSKYNDSEVLDAMLAVAEITELDFENICRTNLSTWWCAIFDKLIRDGKCPPLTKLEFTGSYKGADVLAPKKGLYNNIVVVDAKSLYPSVGINYNLSFDTINCSCCKNNSDAKLSKLIPAKFTKDCKFVNPNTDWICRQHIGAFPSRLKVFKAERLKQKDLGNKSKQFALKILINGGYGVFGNKDYSFYDPRVAELVTAAGRFILSEMQHSANYDYGFEIVYGDTDSLFLNNTSDKALKEFQAKFNEKYGIELEIKNRYDKLLLSSNKKHYIGYEKGVVDAVGFEGEKSDRPEFFHKVYSQLIEDIIKQERDPIPNLREAIRKLDLKANPDLLKISKVLKGT